MLKTLKFNIQTSVFPMLKFPIQASFCKRRFKKSLFCDRINMYYIIRFFSVTKQTLKNGSFPKRNPKSKVQPMGK